MAIAANAELGNMRLVFHALNEAGENAVYSVDMGADGRLGWRQQPIEPTSYPTQPGALLTALDDLDLAATAAEENGLTLWADTIAGSISYRQEKADIYLLTNGALRPLQEIVFQSQTQGTGRSSWRRRATLPQRTAVKMSEIFDTLMGRKT
ncbi:MAG: hypothetical protein R3300_16825 [Candidatus Promineifilaceae bacterium]|nr:hypothetical protein [Candidatus Promineifilaceae bacterium]